jgi:hypothetical protein
MWPCLPSKLATESEDTPAELINDNLPRKRGRNQTTDPSTSREWYPWNDRIVSCSHFYFFQMMLIIF